jgi:hypothetical protein
MMVRRSRSRTPSCGEHHLNALSPQPFDRRDERTHLFLVATLTAGAASAAVRVRNLSPTGALVEAPALPAVGSAIVLRRGVLEAIGSVAWAAAGRAGLSFTAPVTVSAWLPTKHAARQAQVDQIAFSVKHAARPVAVSAEPAVANRAVMSSDAAIADLVRLRAELDHLGDLLAQDAAVVATHPEIQLFDSASQQIGKIVEALRAHVIDGLPGS